MIFLKGLLIALIFGIPAGAIGVLCVNRSIEKGFTAGFITGLGSSLADTIYAVIGAFGITLISDFLQQHEKIIALAGGVLIFAYGIFMLLTKNERKIVENEVVKKDETGLLSYFLTSFSIAVLNPATILTFMIAFTSFGITCQNFCQSLSLVVGIFFGTVIWWLTISFTASRFSEKFTKKGHLVLKIICGGLLIGFGILCVIRSLI